MKKLYSVFHCGSDPDGDGLEIGIYDDINIALKSIEKLKKVKGFKNNPNGFEIKEVTWINKTFWEDGFSKYYPFCTFVCLISGPNIIEFFQYEKKYFWHAVKAFKSDILKLYRDESNLELQLSSIDFQIINGVDNAWFSKKDFKGLDLNLIIIKVSS